MSTADHPLRRHSREAVGAFVIAAVVLFVVAASQAGRIQEWLRPGISVKVLMPPEGLYGLSTGAPVEILGTNAGEVREIVIDPGQNMHALVSLDRQVAPFLRRDSRAYIKRRFGVAGDAYLEITRGTGEALDLDYAVLEATGERIPTQTVEQLIGEVRSRLLPILDQAEDAIGAIAEVSKTVTAAQDDVTAFLGSLRSVAQRIERGEGTIGRLVTDATLVDDLEQVLLETRASMARLTPILDEMQGVARNAALMSERLGEQSAAIPEVTTRAVSALDSLDSVMRDIKRTTPQLPTLARNMSDTTRELPTLLLQSQQTLLELESLLRQLRSSWLLGGGSGSGASPPARVPPVEISP